MENIIVLREFSKNKFPVFSISSRIFLDNLFVIKNGILPKIQLAKINGHVKIRAII